MKEIDDDPEMQRLMALFQEATARALQSVELLKEAQARTAQVNDASTLALAEAQKQRKLWEDAARARGIDPDLIPGLRPCPFHAAEQYWPNSRVGPGTVKTQFAILEDWGPENGGLYVEVALSWAGEYEQPESWEIKWAHSLGYLADNLSDYLFRYSPVPSEMMKTFLGSLSPELRDLFGQEMDYQP
jgi:hypothetical protein